MGIRVFIVGYEMEYEKSFFCKIGSFGESLATGISREFKTPNNRMVRLYFLSCSDPVVLTLQLLACSTCVTHFDEVPLASQLRDLIASCLLIAHS